MAIKAILCTVMILSINEVRAANPLQNGWTDEYHDSVNHESYSEDQSKLKEITNLENQLDKSSGYKLTELFKLFPGRQKAKLLKNIEEHKQSGCRLCRRQQQKIKEEMKQKELINYGAVM